MNRELYHLYLRIVKGKSLDTDVLKRNDIKKSEIYDSDYLGGTVPAYDAYMSLKKVLISGKVKKGGA